MAQPVPGAPLPAPAQVPQHAEQRVPIFEQVSAPLITLTSRDFLIDWRTRRRQYEALMRRHGNQHNMYSIKDSFDYDVLDSLLRYELGVPIEECDDTLLFNWINWKIADGAPGNRAAQIDSAYADVRLDLSEKDPHTRVLKFFREFDIISDKENLNQYWHDNPKLRKDRVVAALAPEGLRLAVEQAILSECREAKTNPLALYQLVKAKVLVFNEVYLANEAVRLRKLQQQPPPPTRPPAGAKPRSRPPPPTPAPSASPPAAPAPGASGHAGQRAPRSKSPPSPCPNCAGDHWKRECPQPQRPRQQPVDQPPRHIARVDGTARAARQWQVVFKNGVEIPGRADNGADETIIPSCLIDELEARGMTLPVIEIKPQQFQLGNDPSAKAVIRRMVTLALTLQTPLGPVTFPSTECFVMEGAARCILLGNPVLQAVGIDVDAQLLSIARQQNSPAADEELLDSVDDMAVIDDDDLTIERNIVDLISAARNAGLRSDLVVQIERATRRASYNLRERLGVRPPAKFPPYLPRLKPGALPWRCSTRRLNPIKTAWTNKYISFLLSQQLVYYNPTSRWCSALNPVAKGPDDFRATVDLVQVNARTEPIAGTMPVLAERIAHIMRGKKFFASFDALKGFWQFLVDASMQEIYSFRGADGKIYTPTRLPQGATDSPLYFQAMMEEVFKELIDEGVILVWIDDILLLAETEDQLVSVIERFFGIITAHNITLNPKKSCLFMREAYWCGRYYSGDGVREDPARIQALCDMPPPTTARELQQFICAANWMRQSLPDFARVVEPLQHRLNVELASTSKSRHAAARISIALTAPELTSFQQVKDLLIGAVGLSHPSPSDEICLFTDASASGWAICITAVAAWNDLDPIADQQHRPLLFLSGSFHGSQLNWSVIEKEAFPIVHAVERAAYLLVRHGGFRLYCDHRNLVFVFAPTGARKQVNEKLYRWAMKLLPVRYHVFHIPGEQNVWADLLSRWGASAASVPTLTRSIAAYNVINPLGDPTFVWPTEAELAAVQQRHSASAPAASVRRDGLLFHGALVWIPEQDTELLARLLVIAHAGPQGHRGVDATVAALQQHFAITNVRRRVTEFCRQCLLCLQVKGGRVIPRPFAESMHAHERNAVHSIDYCYIGPSTSGHQYVCVSKDHATHMVMLTPASTPTAEGCARHLLQWESVFGMPHVLMSDQGSYFVGEVVGELCRLKNTQQQLTVAYSPWLNGTVERVNKDLVQVTTVLIHEFGIDREYWPELLPLVQANLNHSPMPSLDGHSPCETMTGLPRRSALDGVFLVNHKRWVSLDWTKPKISSSIAKLRASLQQLHVTIQNQAASTKKKNSNRQRGVRPANFTRGDFVLWSKIDRDKFPDKLMVKWLGPYRVQDVREYSVIIEHLTSNDAVEVHASRLKFYHDGSLNVTEPLVNHLDRQAVVGVEAIRSHAPHPRHDYVFVVKWRGLEDAETTSEPFRRLAADVPTILRAYIQASRDKKLRAFAEKQRGFGG